MSEAVKKPKRYDLRDCNTRAPIRKKMACRGYTRLLEGVAILPLNHACFQKPWTAFQSSRTRARTWLESPFALNSFLTP